MIKTETLFTEKMQKELSKKQFKLWLFLLIFSSIFEFFTIILSFMGEDVWSLHCCNLIVVVFSIICIRTNFKNRKNCVENKIINSYEFDQEYFYVSTTKNGDNLGNMKIYYKDIIKVKETENYLFLYINRINAYPIDKATTSKEDLILIKGLIEKSKK